MQHVVVYNGALFSVKSVIRSQMFFVYFNPFSTHIRWLSICCYILTQPPPSSISVSSLLLPKINGFFFCLCDDNAVLFRVKHLYYFISFWKWSTSFEICPICIIEIRNLWMHFRYAIKILVTNQYNADSIITLLIKFNFLWMVGFLPILFLATV